MRFSLPLIALAACAAVPALATEQSVTVRVAYSDVDVTTAEGRAAIEARIDARLKKACSLAAPAPYSHGRTVVDTKCLAEARAAAKAEIERVALLETRSARTAAAN